MQRLQKEVLCDRETCISWYEDVGLLLREKSCSKCHRDMKVVDDRKKDKKDHTCTGQLWRCRNRKHSDIERSRAERTWFERCHTTMEDCLKLTFCFARDMSFEDAINETSYSLDTSSDRHHLKP